MSVRSHQRIPTNNASTGGRKPTMKTMASKVAAFTTKRTGGGGGRPRPNLSAKKSISDPTLVMNEMDFEELYPSKPTKLITEVNDKNIDEVLNLPDLSLMPTTFLTEIEQDEVYGTILEELRKKRIHSATSKSTPVQQQQQQQSFSPHFLVVDDDDHDNKSLNDAISSSTSGQKNYAPSNDGYDTDIELESVVKENQDSIGTEKYRELCEQAKIVPCSYFMAHTQNDEMVLRYHQFSTDDIRVITKTLTTNYNVERLFLDGNYLQQQAAKYISRLLLTNDYITELSLVDNRLGGGEGTKEICRMLKINQNLRKINLSGNKFNEFDVTQLIEAFEHNTTLRELDLSHNGFGEKCGEALGAFISDNDTLESINLSWNNFRGQSAIDMINGIKENIQLRRCNLEMNGFGPAGGKILAECLKENTVLEEFNINANRLNTPNAFAIAQALLSNDTLHVLKIADNQINSDGVLAVFLCVKANETNRLREIDFSRTVVTKETLNICEDIVKLKDGKFKYHVGKVTPEMLQSNSTSECYIKTNEGVLTKLRKNAAKVKPNVD